MTTSTAIADRLEVKRLTNRPTWTILLDGRPVYADRRKALCNHFVEHIIRTETAEPGSSAILREFEKKAARR